MTIHYAISRLYRFITATAFNKRDVYMWKRWRCFAGPSPINHNEFQLSVYPLMFITANDTNAFRAIKFLRLDRI